MDHPLFRDPNFRDPSAAASHHITRISAWQLTNVLLSRVLMLPYLVMMSYTTSGVDPGLGAHRDAQLGAL